PIVVYNTFGRKKELFVPVEPGRVRMYVCGPTVYDSSHIGHARSVVVFDVIARYFKSQGFEVTYVRNFTDIDDKIIRRANELGVDPEDLAEKYIHEFYEDMDALNVERASFEPKATDHIPGIINVIQRLLERGYAYRTNGDVFYSVDSFHAYGKLSGRKLEEMEAGARVDVDERKRNPFDFALWKSAKPGEPFWDSPWGNGRPGWHIECSAMSIALLGETIDIHGGGKDLVFPHHENEIAQSEAAFGKPFVKYWIHNGFININQEKMSKSLGNFMKVKDILKTYHPEAVRLFLLSKHYRSPIDFTMPSMDEATSNLDKVYALLSRIEEMGVNLKDGIPAAAGKGWERFCKAMDNDFNTAQGISVLLEEVRNANRLLDEFHEIALPDHITAIASDVMDIHAMCDVLGIITMKPEVYFESKRSKGLEKQEVDPETVERLIQERTEARNEKNWQKADEIRATLEKMNISLEDREDGTIWKMRS
ncbi:MAG: cysteine--tRNA ligase, partial [Deltaproteobacteria bacterium RBG_13_49_15]